MYLRRIFLAALAFIGLVAQPLAYAQIKPKPKLKTAQPAPKPAVPIPGIPHVALETSLGTIILRIESERAPKTSANFLKYVDQKRYDGQNFYRTTRNWGAPSTVIQAGVRTDARLILPPVAHEATSATGLTHCPGSVSLARNAPGTGTSDIFLALGPIYGFDADPKAAKENPSADNAGFAVFAELVGGWSVAEAIAAAPVSDTLGAGVMKGQMIAAPVKIIRAVRVPPPAVVDPAKPKPGCVVKALATTAVAPAAPAPVTPPKP